MSHGENKGLQISLIIFTGLAIILGVSTFAFYRQLEDQRARVEALTTQAAIAETEREAATRENKVLKQVISSRADTDVESIKQDHQRDMSRVHADVAHETIGYQQMLVSMYRAVKNAAQGEQEARETIRVKDRQLTKQRGALEAELTVQREFSQELIGDLASERAKFNEDRARYKKIWDDLAGLLNEKAKLILSWEFKYDEMKRLLSSQLKQTRNEYTAVRDNWERLKKDTFETPDGKLTEVFGRHGVAYINLGSDDLLRTQIVFGVFDAETSNLVKSRRKGSVEVVRIRGPKVAEVRIIQESLADPLMPDDLIFTPIWKAGDQRRFALVGVIDLDADGKSDRRLVRSLISQSGGVIDAEVDQWGGRTGKLTVDTRYVIVGSRPSDMRAYKQTIAEAKRLGIDQLSISKLRELTGYTLQKRPR